MNIEENTLPRNIKGIAKVLEMYRFGIVEYSVRSESSRMIALRAQTYYVPRLPKYLRIIYPQGIRTSAGYMGNFISHFRDEHDSYAEINLKEDKSGWQKAEPVERVYVKYDPKNNLPNHEATLPNHR